jgi:hypothetical protein
LAIVEAILEAFGSDGGGGYDTGCKFATTLDASSLGPRARALRYKSLVGSFHGHAHNRLCQLSHLATYVKGMGLEDLEGCERFFSKSNALASALRYASIFHRKQKIVQYMKHSDTFETYQNLSTSLYSGVISCLIPLPGKFLVDNYSQALGIIQGEKALEKTMEDQGIKDKSVFPQWLEEERVYLKGLSKEPIRETQEMEYYQKLVNLQASTYVLPPRPLIFFDNKHIGRHSRWHVMHGKS